MNQLMLVPMISLALYSCSNRADNGGYLNLQKLSTEIPDVIIHVDLPVSVIDEDLLRRVELFPREAQSLMVPPATVNLAKGKPVTTSVIVPQDVVIGSLEGLTDGNKGRQAGDFTEFYSESPLYVQVDLGEPCTLQGVWLWRKWGEKRDAVIFEDTVVQIAADLKFKDNVRTLFSSDIDNSVGAGAGDDKLYYETRFGRLFPCYGTIGRFVRVHSGGPRPDRTGNSFVEIEVYGSTVNPNNSEQISTPDASPESSIQR